MKVQELRTQGYRVFVKHSRFFRINHEIGSDGNTLRTSLHTTVPLTRNAFSSFVSSIPGIVSTEFLPRGGRTEVEIYRGEELIGSGVANCSKNDAYNKKIGRSIALGRALENLKMSSCNWSEILEEVGLENVRRFAIREMTARNFESLSTTTRKLVRELGAEEVRNRARQALSRRRALPSTT